MLLTQNTLINIRDKLLCILPCPWQHIEILRSISCRTSHCFTPPDSRCLNKHHATFIISAKSARGIYVNARGFWKQKYLRNLNKHHIYIIHLSSKTEPEGKENLFSDLKLVPLNFSFRNRREKWFTKSQGTEGPSPRPPNIFKKDICHFTTYSSPDQMHSLRLQFQWTSWNHLGPIESNILLSTVKVVSLKLVWDHLLSATSVAQTCMGRPKHLLNSQQCKSVLADMESFSLSRQTKPSELNLALLERNKSYIDFPILT